MPPAREKKVVRPNLSPEPADDEETLRQKYLLSKLEELSRKVDSITQLGELLCFGLEELSKQQSTPQDVYSFLHDAARQLKEAYMKRFGGAAPPE